MEDLTHSLNYELPKELHFDKYAQHILENSRTSPNLADTTTIALASSPSITSLEPSSLDASHQTTTSDFLKKLGASFIHSIQLQSLPKTNSFDSSYSSSVHTISRAPANDMDMEFGPPQHLVMDSQHYNDAMDELQKQLDYDKFMNEIWIGVVLTLILISMIFCFCSCFLYHQFRMWKRNYRTTVVQTTDVEAVKFNMDLEDPVPEYTLVSGLPSYEAALELLHKNPQSCLIVHPSVFEVFNKHEKSPGPSSAKVESAVTATTTATSSANITEVLVPLLNDSNHQNENKSAVTAPSEASNVVTPSTPAPAYNHSSLASLLSLATQRSSSAQCKSKSTSSEADKQYKV